VNQPADPSLWNQLAERGGVTLQPEQHQKISKYLELLLAANARMNLTRIVDPKSAEILHVGDALTILPYLPAGEHRLADVGSGGGVPGIILAIARPDAQVALIEATKKKADYLKSAAGELGLANVTVLPIRAEEAGRSEWRELFDVALARAVATLDWLAEWMLPLVKKGGVMLAMKGAKAGEELAGVRRLAAKLGGGNGEILPVELPGAEHHVIVRFRKIGRTDPRWPRAASAAKGRPPA
jgi:16S rRNA (guanine527-N7)-methyltransferase